MRQFKQRFYTTFTMNQVTCRVHDILNTSQGGPGIAVLSNIVLKVRLTEQVFHNLTQLLNNTQTMLNNMVKVTDNTEIVLNNSKRDCII
jgi:hypothetical protein